MCFFTAFNGQAQGTKEIKQLEDSLVKMLAEVHSTPHLKTKLELNSVFELKLRELLRIDAAFTHEFDTLSKVMGTITSPDNKFRLFNWNLERNEYGEQLYFCLIMKYDEKREEYITIELFDKSKYARDIHHGVFTDKKWLGAVYYKIIPVQKGNKTIYTLLGWDGNNMLSNKKIVETMAFNGSGKVKFGFPIFKMEDDKSKRRIIFQYKKMANFSLTYHVIKKKPTLVFDHLIPESPQLAGIGDYNVPDGSFDGLIWDGSHWKLKKDIKPRGKPNKNDVLWNNPKRD